MSRLVLVVPLAILSACGGGTSSSSLDASIASSNDASSSSADAGPSAVTDFAQPGPAAVSVSSGTVVVPGDCSLPYTLYSPPSASSSLVVLGHGFARGPDNMADLAEHVASYGVRVAVPDFCHLSFLDTDHVANGHAAAALGAALAGDEGVIYAGFSAGGLAAALAAAQADAVTAVLGLDAVDAGGAGASALEELTVPRFSMVGEPSSCNAQGSGATMFQPPSRAIRLIGAVHCDFEAPTDGLCNTTCGASTDAAPVIRALAAAFVAWQAGTDATGADWVTPEGDRFRSFLADGVLEVL